MSEAVLVVDFGTSSSSAALVVAGQPVRLIKEPASGLYNWPSAVCRTGDALLVGTVAERRKRADPAAYRAEFKRDLGETAPIPLGEADYRPEELVAAVLRVFGERAAELHGGSVPRLLLTVPASYGPGDPRRDVMIGAGEAAGFAEVELAPEPVAAALAPLSGAPFADGDLVLVYDFGGGTFDAALVRFAGGRHEVLGHAALDDCGGRDIDALISAHLHERGGEELAGALGTTALAAPARLRLGLQVREFVRGVKHQLSDAEDVEDYLTPLAPPYQLHQRELAELIAPLVARTVACSMGLLAAGGVRAADLTAVLLTGGTCRTPAVAAAVERGIGRPVRRTEDPDLAVTQGAAALAARAGDRALDPVPPPAGATPLRWDEISGRLVRWLVGPGEEYAAGAPLGVVRLDGLALVRLCAPDRPGRLVAVHATPGSTVAAGDWLVTVEGR
ncbi:Hsp70 family protein [Dactylosporangium sp. CS-047395]|uniref:Hsp70 family protein n=1 Tax=Dactylosporangium sp. CS-047395 TaxID=3239936 RepID=UPI003D8DDD81